MFTYERLLSYGNVFSLKPSCDPSIVKKEISNFEFGQYNSAKPEINRKGLSITSLNGELNGIDLESLNGSECDEGSFRALTDVYYSSPELQKIIDPFKDHLGRTHFLNVRRGGYFPPHRDEVSAKQKFMRVIVPIYHFNPPFMYFVYDNKILELREGQCYFINTNVEHNLFSYSNDSLMIVINLICNDASYECVMRQLHNV